MFKNIISSDLNVRRFISNLKMVLKNILALDFLLIELFI